MKRPLKYVSLALFAAALFCTVIQLFISASVNYEANAPKNPNVIIVVIDALRPDHLRCYGYGKNTSPNIDRLAKESTLFKACVTVYPRTTPSAVSMLTGLYPHTHGVRNLVIKKEEKRKWSNLTLTRILKNEEYDTGVFSAIDLPMQVFGKDELSARATFRSDQKVTEKAISWLKLNRKKRRPFFLMLWLNSPHWPYSPPAEEIKMFTTKKNISLERLIKRGEEEPGLRIFEEMYSQQELEFLISAYDGEIHFADKQVGMLIDYLKGSGLYDNSVIVITSDHGESLGEHGVYFEHGEYYYDTTALVPLLIKKPYQDTKEIIEHQVRNIDIFPTILSMLGVNYACEGKNLLPELEEEKKGLEDLLAFGESGHSLWRNNRRRYIKGTAGKWRIARSNRYKLIFIPHPQSNIFELYDIKNDSSEKNNLINDPRYQSEIEYLKGELFGWIKKEDLQNTEEFTTDQVSDDTLESLRSLGYVQ